MKITIEFHPDIASSTARTKVIDNAVVISVGSEYLRVETLAEKYHFPVKNILMIQESGDD